MDKNEQALDWTDPIGDGDEFEKTDQATIDAIKARLPQYLGMITDPSPKAGKDFYNCPFCGSGTKAHKTGALHLSREKNVWECRACHRGGDIFSLIAYKENLDIPGKDRPDAFLPVLTRAKEIFNMTDNPADNASGTPKNEQTAPEGNNTTQTEKDDSAQPGKHITRNPGQYTEYIEDCVSHVNETDYLKERGLSEETIKLLRLGYDRSHRSVVFVYDPEDCYYYTRRIDTKQFYKAKLQDDEMEPIYDPLKYLTDGSAPCFIVESPLDAAAIIQSGGHAAALVGTASGSLLKVLETEKPKQPLILMLDDDQKGQENQKKLADSLKEKKIPFIQARIDRSKYPEPHKDANDLLRGDPERLRRDVRALIRQVNQPENIFDYIRKDFSNDIKTIQSDLGRKTGFHNIDKEIGSLFSGLYVIGGTSGSGKTTWMLQLANQAAAAGQHVLFFSLEQSKFELTCKSLAWEMFSEDIPGAITSSKMRRGKSSPAISEAADKYARKIGTRLSIWEGNMSTTVSDIERKTKLYIQRNNVRPIILVDYLQVLPAPREKMSDPYVIVTENIIALKRLSRDYSVPVIVLSSLNRANYLYPVSFESFRESGNVEYSADFVAGIQLAAVHADQVRNEKKVSLMREYMSKAMSNPKRAIEFSVLKNRFGKSNWSAYFDYYIAKDLYVEHPEEFTSGDYVDFFGDNAAADPDADDPEELPD